jgi:hypothetical protein
VKAHLGVLGAKLSDLGQQDAVSEFDRHPKRDIPPELGRSVLDLAETRLDFRKRRRAAGVENGPNSD